jgi:HAD superfamily phosphatase (TIGR01681 family)
MNKQCLVILDLDGTLIHPEDQHEDFSILSKMVDRGYILAIASRNDHYRVMEVLQEFNIIEYFKYVMADFRPKVYQIREIITLSNEEGMKFDEVVFVDDYQPNIERVNLDEPDVITYQFGEAIHNLAELVRVLEKTE